MPFIFYGIGLFIMSGISDQLMKAATDNYWLIAKIVSSIAVITAFGRIFFNQITLGSYGDLKGIFKDCLKFLVFIAFTPLVFTQSIEFVDNIAEQINVSAQATNYKSFDEISASIKSGEGNQESGVAQAIQFLSTNSAELYKACVTWLTVTIAQALHYLRNLAILILFASAPVFIYLGVLLNLRYYSNIVLSLGASLLIWPILSALLTKFSVNVFEADSANLNASMSQGSALLIFALFQLYIPVFVLKSAFQATGLISGSASSAGKSLKGLGLSIGKALSQVKG